MPRKLGIRPTPIRGQSAIETLRILIAEDDAMIAMFLGDLLAQMGHEVCAIVDTEKDTIFAAARYLPDLMIVDEGLNEGSGVAAVAEILRWDFVPHFFITGDRIRTRALAPGAIIIQKPFLAFQLKRAIEKAGQATGMTKGAAK